MTDTPPHDLLRTGAFDAGRFVVSTAGPTAVRLSRWDRSFPQFPAGHLPRMGGVEAALQARSEQYVDDIFRSLRDVAVASRSNKPIGDRMIMNAAFLVSRDRESAYDTRVKEIGQRHDKLTFKYTGPWPPYNFVNIKLKLERATH